MFVVSVSYGQQDIDNINNTKLEEVVVTATKTLRQLSTLPLPVNLISNQEITTINLLFL